MDVFSIGPVDGAYNIPAENGEASFMLRLNEAFMSSDWFCVTMYTAGGDDAEIRLEWIEGKDAQKCVQMRQKLIPCCKAELSFPINASDTFQMHRHFLAPYSALRKGEIRGTPMDKANIRFVRISVTSKALKSVVFYGTRVCKNRPACVLDGTPLVDRFGQRIAGEWQNKIHSETELISSLREEYRCAKESVSYPQGWSKWGGWLKKQLGATGFFRLEHDGRRWWLVDPDGYAFFSNGICYGERAGIFTFTDEYKNLYEWLPDENGEFADAWSNAANIPQYTVRNGKEGAGRRRMFNFTRANLIRAFGDRWHEAYTLITSARLHRMGFNTIGVGTNDYYDERTLEFLRGAEIPYVITFRDFPQTAERIFRDFPDVFGDEYRARCREFASRSLKNYVNDPYMIGYFVTNEPEWLFAGSVNLAERLIDADGCTASKAKLIDYLKGKYKTIERLNAAWDTKFDSFGVFYDKPKEYSINSVCTEDLNEFERILIEAYGRIVSEALHEIDPNHLNLGMRYAYIKDKILGYNLDYFDVFSVNCYSRDPKKSADCIADSSYKPVMVGEWHIGAKDAGLPAYGLRFTDTQAQRRDACRYYAETATVCRNLVGIHYFEYHDQPYFGRFDGECYSIGLVDVCQSEYSEVCSMFADFAKRMYPLLEGEIQPAGSFVEIKK